jgi:hypothetical protein
MCTPGFQHGNILLLSCIEGRLEDLGFWMTPPQIDFLAGER